MLVEAEHWSICLNVDLSLIGATVITIGFYTVMWGKAKEVALVEDDSKANHEEANEADLDSPSGSQKAPLLESYKNDEHVWVLSTGQDRSIYMCENSICECLCNLFDETNVIFNFRNQMFSN